MTEQTAQSQVQDAYAAFRQAEDAEAQVLSQLKREVARRNYDNTHPQVVAARERLQDARDAAYSAYAALEQAREVLYSIGG